MMKKILFFLFLFTCSAHYSQTLDVDLIEINKAMSSEPIIIAKSDSKVYFTASNGLDKCLLWVYDIATDGVSPIKNIIPNCNSNFGRSAIIVNNEIYFMVYGGSHQLWKSDGTTEGTFMIKQFGNSDMFEDSQFIEFNGDVYFQVNDGINGFEFWKTDGTEAGTSILTDVNPSTSSQGYLSKPIIIDDMFYFTVRFMTSGSQLWGSNGTPEGTMMVKDFSTGSGSSINGLFAFDNKLFFNAMLDYEQGSELWVSDGTGQGTTLLKNINPTPYASGIMNSLADVVIFEDHFYFYANNGVVGSELWRSDGTSEGTVLFKNLAPGILNSAFTLRAGVLDDRFVFATNNYNSPGYTLWSCDGTTAGTEIIKVFNNASFSAIFDEFRPVVFDGSLYFAGTEETNGGELWKTDGTAEGTTLVKNINSSMNYGPITNFTATDGLLYFRSPLSSLSGHRLWRSDGTEAGTFIVSDYEARSYSQYKIVDLENGNVLFPAGYDLDDYNGNELYKTDGTVEGTRVFDMNVSGGSGPVAFIAFNDKLIFSGVNSFLSKRVPFITDGTLNGTKAIKDEIGYHEIDYSGEWELKFTKAGNNVFYRARKNGFGNELFRTDGTSEGTFMLKDIHAGASGSLSEYMLFMEYNNLLYFKADDGIHGEELWRSDGTEAGTYLLKDIYSGPTSGITASNKRWTNEAVPEHKAYGVINNILYFSGEDEDGFGIFKTDGTATGTVKAIPNTSNDMYEPIIINNTSQKIFYKKVNAGEDGGSEIFRRLWSSDGTPEGSIELLNLPEGNSNNNFRRSIVFNDELYIGIQMFFGEGESLYKSDGTVEGTVLLKSGFASGLRITKMVVSGSYVYFTVHNDWTNNNGELWRSDGTPNGTVQIESIPNANILSLKDINGTLFYLNSSHDKIWYINDGMTEPNYFEVDILKLNTPVSFSDYGYIGELSSLGNKLVFSATTALSGTELYTAVIDVDLSNNPIKLDEVKNLLEFSIYPNPSLGKININSVNSFAIDSVEIFDLTGKKLHQENFNALKAAVDLSSLGSGVYLVKVLSGKYSRTYKVIMN